MTVLSRMDRLRGNDVLQVSSMPRELKAAGLTSKTASTFRLHKKPFLLEEIDVYFTLNTWEFVR